MISKPEPAYDNAMHAVWQTVRVAAILAVLTFLLSILHT
jgi:hypothetical protein